MCNSCFISHQKENEPKTSEVTQEESPKKVLRHVVLFNFNETATEDIIKKVEQAFAALPDKIPQIHSFEWGINKQ